MSRTGRHLHTMHHYAEDLFVGERACFLPKATPSVRRPLSHDVHPHQRGLAARRALAAAHRLVKALEACDELDQFDLFACGNREALAEWRGIFVAVAREVRRSGKYYRPAGGMEFRRAQ